MKYILILIYSFLLTTFAFSADNLLMFKNSEGNTYQLLKIDQSSGSETVVTSITLDQAIATDNSYFDAYENKFYIHQGAGLTSEIKVYDFNSDSWSDAKRSSGGSIYSLAPYRSFVRLKTPACWLRLPAVVPASGRLPIRVPKT